MRSINIKRTAAIAAGAAMIGSVLAPALATIGPDQATVDALIANIKANPNDVSIVVGTNGAEITDGIAAAKIATVLASLNYEQTEISSEDLTCTTDGTPTVEVETTGAVTPTESNYIVELTGGAGSTAYQTSALGSTTTITKENFDALKQYSLTIIDNSTGSNAQHTYYYEDKIILGSSIYAKYDEDSSGNSGHGLYLYAPYGSIKYKIDFGTSGIPIGSWVNYQEVPEIEILGKKYGLDWKHSSSSYVSLYTGTKQTLNTGDSIETADGVTVLFQSGTGTTTASGYFKITGPEGTEVITSALSAGDSYETTVDGVKVSVTVDSIGYDAANSIYTAQIRVGTGTKKLQPGVEFPFDTDWTVDSISTTGSGNYLTGITLKYGNPSKSMDYNFQGTYLTGLKEGTTINGPKKADGTPLFTLQLGGLGSKSTTYHTTDVEFEGKGLNSSATQLLWATWTARNGKVQKFTPENPAYVQFASNNTWYENSTNYYTGSVNLNATSAMPKRWTIINDKVVYFQSATLDTDTGLYDITFYIGGDSSNGELKTLTNVNGTTGALLEDGATVNPIRCNITVNGVNDINITDPNSQSNTSKMTAGTDATSGYCDLYPDVVPIGNSNDIAASKSLYLDLTNVLNTSAYPNATINEVNGQKIYVTWDSVNTGGSSDLLGMKAGSDAGGNNYIDQTLTTSDYDSYKYHITNASSVIDGSETNKLKVTLADAVRNAYIQITSEAAETTAGTQVVGEGDTVSGVKIVKINVPEYTVSGAVTGTYYVKKDAVFTEANIIKDTDPITTTYAIVVGGPFVNKVAQEMAAKDMVTQEGASYVYAEGNKLLVAGYSATDTTAAADELIQLLKA